MKNNIEGDYFSHNYTEEMGFDFAEPCEACGHFSSYIVRVYTPESDLYYEYEDGFYYDHNDEIIEDVDLIREIEDSFSMEPVVHIVDRISCSAGQEKEIVVSEFREWFDNGSWLKKDFDTYRISPVDLLEFVDKMEAEYTAGKSLAGDS